MVRPTRRRCAPPQSPAYVLCRSALPARAVRRALLLLLCMLLLTLRAADRFVSRAASAAAAATGKAVHQDGAEDLQGGSSPAATRQLDHVAPRQPLRRALVLRGEARQLRTTRWYWAWLVEQVRWLSLLCVLMAGLTLC